MFKLRFRRKLKPNDYRKLSTPGAAPGTLVADPDAPKTVVRTLAYGQTEFVEGEVEDIEDLEDLIDYWPVTWIDVRGFGDIKRLKKLGNVCNLHNLALEDVVNLDQRPKVEEYGQDLFVVIRMLESTEATLAMDQLSLFISDNFIATFQATDNDCLDPVRDRIRKQRSRLRKSGADYLAYTIIDAVIDAYFPVLEEYGKKIEALEDRILNDPQESMIAEIHEIKRELLVLRRNIWPVREVLKSLTREQFPSISEETRIYLRDCYDHALRIIDLIESYRLTCKDIMDLYLSIVSNKMNEVMKVLTVISTIFIPPTFVAGVYGMNFNTEASKMNMPELNSSYGYPLCLATMALMSITVIYFLYSRGWLRTK